MKDSILDPGIVKAANEAANVSIEAFAKEGAKRFAAAAAAIEADKLSGPCPS